MTDVPDSPSPERALVTEALSVLRHAATLSNSLDTALREYGLTIDRWRALLLIQLHPGAAMADVIDALVIPPTSATRAIDALVDSGAIYRSPAPDDRRRVTLQLSVHGAYLVSAVESVVAAIYRDSSASEVAPAGRGGRLPR